MRQAYQEAVKAFDEDEIPVGAVVVSKNKVIGRGYNQTERLTDVTAHAEMLAITAASSFLGSKYLRECTLFVTLEPCAMCAGALAWSQIAKVVYAAPDLKKGFRNHGQLLHKKTELSHGLMEKESSELLRQFFESKRT